MSVPCSRVVSPSVDTHAEEGWPTIQCGLSKGSRQTPRGVVEISECSGSGGARVRMEGSVEERWRRMGGSTVNAQQRSLDFIP